MVIRTGGAFFGGNLQECLYDRLHGARDGENGQNLQDPEKVFFTGVEMVFVADRADRLQGDEDTRENGDEPDLPRRDRNEGGEKNTEMERKGNHHGAEKESRVILRKNPACILNLFVFFHLRHAPYADSRSKGVERQKNSGDQDGEDAAVEQVPVRENGGAQKKEEKEGTVNEIILNPKEVFTKKLISSVI